MFKFELSGRSYARLSRTTSEDESDGGTFAVNNVVAGAGTAPKAELAGLERSGHSDGSCIKQVRDGSGVLHFDC